MKQIFILLFGLLTINLSANTNADSTRLVQLQIAIANLDAVDDHCEVPCGIYGDTLRFALIDEHIRTVEKATNQIIELSAADIPNYNQLVRWINNKEKHAEEIQDIVSQYFLHQRIKLVDPKDKEATKKYNEMLGYLHQISVYSMKAKQGTDLDNIAKLKASVEGFESVYFHKH